MNIAVIGLGLIGGSFAKAFAEAAHNVFVYDIDKATEKYACMTDNFTPLTDDILKECDLTIVATYPETVIDYINEKKELFKKSSFVVDTAGIKRKVCESCFKISDEYGFIFIGGHPMAGTQFSGYKYSSAELFNDASMLICPKDGEDIYNIDKISKIMKEAGFGKVVTINPEEHDRLIAFTSQLAHIVSNAYIKSPTARDRKNCSAGSYKDMTRVAWLNENMWTDLFIQNKDMIINELDYLIKSLNEYKEAINNEDKDNLIKILRDGRIAKEEIDG